jgi:hypothetical protein
MPTYRMLASTVVSAQSRTVNGRTYSAVPGQALDIFDADAETLAANGWISVCLSGPTSARPSPNLNVSPPYIAAPGFKFLDTTLGKIVVYDGAAFRDPVTGDAV